jgi:UDPglucose--hexose-1-phosphate uridylyltransferase
VQRRVYRKSDGRTVYLYAEKPHALPVLGEGEGAPEARSHLRWHPLRGEWVVYAAHRQERTFLPPSEFCPLCPTRSGAFPTEIPFEDFDIAVFENRFPAFLPHAPDPPHLWVPTARAEGVCEVVVYTPEHEGSVATLSQARRELLVRVWADRYRDLYAREGTQFVMPFENRGEPVGVTLHHPHGQIYAYPFVPPILQHEVMAFRGGQVLVDLLTHVGGTYTVVEDERVVAMVPPFARYPYEVWILPRAPRSGPWQFDGAEVASFAWILGEIVGRYDALFHKPFPYVMVLHAAPKGEDDCFHFHVEFYPPLRTAERLKYLAGTELGAGTFIMDALPEETARILREVVVHRS